MAGRLSDSARGLLASVATEEKGGTSGPRKRTQRSLCICAWWLHHLQTRNMASVLRGLAWNHGEDSPECGVPREPSEPQNALFQGSFSLLKNLGSPLHQGPKHATYKPIVLCPIVHTTFFWRTLPMVMAGSCNSKPCLLLLGLTVK